MNACYKPVYTVKQMPGVGCAFVNPIPPFRWPKFHTDWPSLRYLPVLLTLLLLGVSVGEADDFLPPELAFQVNSKIIAPDKVNLSWKIADNCYLYRHRFKIESATQGIQVVNSQFPEGQAKTDHIFGQVQIYKREVSVNVDLRRTQLNATKVNLNISYQGCAESGMCYLPEHKTVTVNLPEQTVAQPNSADLNVVQQAYGSEQDQIVDTLNRKPVWFVILSFFGFGLLLAFTPCVFPMLPIISGIIAGHGQRLCQAKAFTLSFCYVLASALTYTAFGIIAGLFGSNLQAILQTPWGIASFSALFVVLALPMFGLFELQLPGFLQSKLAIASGRQRDGSYLGASIMGIFSALIIGPCVTAPLAGALLYIGQTGDAMLGGAALFALGMGMGLPLLIVGTYAGSLMPKAGAWMNAVKAVFGIGLLAVAIWLLSRIIPAAVTMALWFLLASLPVFLLMHRRRWRLAGFAVSAYGLLIWLGWSGHYSSQIPGMVCEVVQTCEAKLSSSLNFRKVTSLQAVHAELEQAAKVNKPVLLDFYADWCTTCVEMKHGTFTDTAVHQALSDVVLLQADVTGHSPNDKALLKHFNIIGPPAILFFKAGYNDLKRYRVIGYADSESLLNVVDKAFH